MIRLLPVLALLLPLCARADEFSTALGEIQESAAKAKIRMAQLRVVPKRPAAPADPVRRPDQVLGGEIT